jgi:hypothetical protein
MNTDQFLDHESRIRRGWNADHFLDHESRIGADFFTRSETQI